MMVSPTTKPNLTVNSNDDNVIHETAVSVLTALIQGTVKSFYNNHSKLKAELKMANIFLKMTDLENKDIVDKHKQIATTSDALTKVTPLFIPQSYVEAKEPFASLISQKNKKSKKVLIFYCP